MTKSSEASLEFRTHRGTVGPIAVAAIALFASAGTFRYWQGWAYVMFQLGSMTATNLYLLRHDRDLARRRLAVVETGESARVQKMFFALLRPLALGMLVVAGLDHRLGWSTVPLSVVLAGCLGLASGSLLIFRVFLENSHASSVIEVGTEQAVVATGPYRSVRHPMYSGVLLGTLATPLALGSYVAALFFFPIALLFVVRLLAEERHLAGALRGYDAYMRETRKRLIPGVW
jgi:protein-S-isoprenylcysteine O-methyltransferase Ste14